MLGWYQTNIVDAGRAPILWALIGFVVAFGVTRWITLRIRARNAANTQEQQPGAIKDVIIGGVHIHHQVWGILLILITGLLEFRYRPGSPWQEILGLLFGVGAALALDEFALWLHLEDVYWSPEGRKSIDAVIIAVVVAIAVFMGSSPVGLDSSSAIKGGYIYTVVFLLFHFAYVIICMLKGKIVTGIVGLPIPGIALIGAIRLAKPESFWARRFYKEPKMVRATARLGKSQVRRERVRDVFSGTR